METNVRAEVPLLVAFADLTRFAAQSLRVSDLELAAMMDVFYQRVTSRIDDAGGRVVKFIGDAALIVFSEADADRGVAALLDLKEDIDSFMADNDWECRMNIKAHFGTVIAGPYAGRFDVLGKNVNAAAMLDSTGVALSVEAFRKLLAETRKRFKKHTPPVTYIRLEDPHRLRRR
jgi:adenylate cyclase